MKKHLPSVRAFALSIPLLLAALSMTAEAQGTFNGCGTIVPGVTCTKLFAPDSGGLYVVDLTGFQVGDYVRVTGVIDPNCITICQQGNGCINQSTVTFCSPGTAFCFGDGTLVACPCANSGAPGQGCENSAGTGGALLVASGATNPDTVVLTSSGELSTATSIFLQGSANLAVPVSFGDGIRCVAGNLKRIGVKVAISGTVSYPEAGDPSITQQSSNLGDPIAPGSTRWYQVYYRDPDLSFCPPPQGNSWNVSNGIEIVWL